MIVGIFSPAEEGVISKFQEQGIEIHMLIRSDSNTEDLRQLNPEILICRNRDNIAQFLQVCTNLKFIFINEVGLERLPFDELLNHNVRVANTSGISVDIMSNYGMACILHHSTKLEEDISNKHNHYWKRYQSTDSLADKTLLVVGAGRTGSAIAKKAKAFDMTTLGIVNRKRIIDYFDEVGTLADLSCFLVKADYVICTMPLTPMTRYLFNRDKFNCMKQTSVFINISRGALVNELDLLDAINKGKIAKAYLDVFEIEPLPENHAFWAHPNIIVTPHQSGRLNKNLEISMEYFFDNYRAYQRGDTMPNEVNLDLGY